MIRLMIAVLTSLLLSCGDYKIQLGPENTPAPPTPALTSNGELCEIEENYTVIKGDHFDFELHARLMLEYLLDEYETETPVDPEARSSIAYLKDCLGE